MSCKCCKVPLVWRILIGFILGIVFGLALPKAMGEEALKTTLSIVAPFGSVLVSMLKMVVYPIIFFSLILGAASLPLKKSGRVGGTVIVWYFVTSLFATVFGVVMAFLLNPSIRAAQETANPAILREILREIPPAIPPSDPATQTSPSRLSLSASTATTVRRHA